MEINRRDRNVLGLAVLIMGVFVTASAGLVNPNH